MNPRLLAAAGVAAVAVVVVAVLALAGGGNGDGDEGAVASPGITPAVTATPPPSPTLEVAPTASPTPAATPGTPGTPEEQARNFSLQAIPNGMLEFVTDGPYVVPGDALGVFYLNIETQAIEGWYDLIPGQQTPTQPVAFSADNRFTVFRRDRPAVVGGNTFPPGHYLGDRETRTVYRWEGDAQPVFEKQTFGGNNIAARGDLVLFRVPGDPEGDWYTLFDVAGGTVEVVFQAETGRALISEDGAWIALVGEDVSVVDTGTGEVTRLAEDPFGPVDLEGLLQLIESRDGRSFLFVTSPAKSGFNGVAVRYTWDGERLSELTGARIYPSPRGEYVAVADPLSQGQVDAPLYTMSAFDTADGTSLFRVTGVQLSYDFFAGNRWLADGSGFVVSRGDYRLTVAMRDGSFQEFLGVPSPEAPDVFGVWGGAVDASGREIVVINFQGGIRDLMEMWGDRGDEVRIVIPHLGHGGLGWIATIVEPRVEITPYAAPPQVQLSNEAVTKGLVDVYDAPGGQVIGRLAAPYRVTVEEVMVRCTQLPHPDLCPAIDTNTHRQFFERVTGFDDVEPVSGVWARVTGAGGQTGWMLLQVTGPGQ